MNYLITTLLALCLACSRTTTLRTPSGGELTVQNGQVRDTAWLETEHARALGMVVSPNRSVTVLGSHRGLIAGPQGSLRSAEAGFVLASFGANLEPRGMVSLDTPGHPRGLVYDGDALLLLSDSSPPAVGPLLTRYDAALRVTLRRDLGFGGFATSVESSATHLMLRHQRHGIRVVWLTREGQVQVVSPRLTPSAPGELPLMLVENGLVSQLAGLPDGSVFVLTPRPSEGEPGEPRESLSRVSMTGALLWQRALSLGERPELARTHEGLVVLSENPESDCAEGAFGRGFALTYLDSDGRIQSRRCFPGEVYGLRLASSGRNLLVSGQFRGVLRLGTTSHTTAPDTLCSFVAWFRDGQLLDHAVLGSATGLVAVQALAAEPEGSALMAGAYGLMDASTARVEARQTHLFVLRLSR